MGQRLGQHFLNAQWVARDLLASIGARDGETIVEIGPGRGALTKVLLERGLPVLAIEKDPALVTILHTMFSKEILSGQLRIARDDVRNITARELPTSYVVAANIPYYITGEIIRQFLEIPTQPRTMALLIQKEVAERIVARDGKESILSLSVRAYGTPSIIAKVPARCFNPPPRVDSAILLIDHISRTFFDTIDEKNFFHVVKTGFASKRKMLIGNLKGLFQNAPVVLEECGIDPKARAEDVSLGEWKRIVQKFEARH